jgi:hypothetical protein
MRQFFIIILTGTVVCFSIFPTVTVAQDQSIIASGALVVAGSTAPAQRAGNPFAFTSHDVPVDDANEGDSKGSKGSKPKDGKNPTATNEHKKSTEPRALPD